MKNTEKVKTCIEAVTLPFIVKEASCSSGKHLPISRILASTFSAISSLQEALPIMELQQKHWFWQVYPMNLLQTAPFLSEYNKKHTATDVKK